MDPRSSQPGFSAPGAGGSGSESSLRMELPAPDTRLVAPESRYEIHDGQVAYCLPADQAHGSRHSKVQAVLEAYVADDFDVACDMLTRTSVLDDMAPDASVYPSAPDPVTGGRQLEQLACLLYTSPSPRDRTRSRMPSSA